MCVIHWVWHVWKRFKDMFHVGESVYTSQPRLQPGCLLGLVVVEPVHSNLPGNSKSLPSDWDLP